MEKSPRAAPDIDKVAKAMRDLGEKQTAEVETLQLAGNNSIVVLEYLGDHPRTVRIQLVEDRKGLVTEGVDILVDEESLVHQKIFGRALDGEKITIKDNLVVRILEIIDSDPPKSSEPQ